MGRIAHRAILTSAVLVFLFCIGTGVYAVLAAAGRRNWCDGQFVRLKARGQACSQLGPSGREDSRFSECGSYLRPNLQTTSRLRFPARDAASGTLQCAEVTSRIIADLMELDEPDSCPVQRRACPGFLRPSRGPGAVSPVNWNVGVNSSVEFPHTRGLRVLTQILGAKAMLDAKRGAMGRAVQDVEQGIQVTESLRDEPALAPPVHTRFDHRDRLQGTGQISSDTATLVMRRRDRCAEYPRACQSHKRVRERPRR